VLRYMCSRRLHRSVMTIESFHRKVISGEAGVWAMPLRGLLRLVETPYGIVVGARNSRFDSGAGVWHASVPVISVGNITVGGTGKTPMVIHVVSRLMERACSPAVVARGYGAAGDSVNDEELLIRRRCPQVLYASCADRASAIRSAISQGAGAVVLDDGFQHRAVARDLDLVLVDATCPFGFEHLLPRGLLREPLTALRRADAVVVTRCDAVGDEVVADVVARIHELIGDRPILCSRHLATGVSAVDGLPLSSNPHELLAGARICCFSAIGNPASFEQAVANLGATVVGAHRFDDHHRYTSAELRRIMDDADGGRAEYLVTTEKDAVKIAQLDLPDRDRIVALAVEIDFMGDDGTILDQLLDRTLESHGQQ